MTSLPSSITLARHMGIIAVVFVASRLLYAAMGLSFDVATLDAYFQWIDPVLLENNLLESLIHLHGQPPLFNLFLGLVLKTTGVSSFKWIFIGTGLALACLLYFSMYRLGIQPRLACLLSCLFIAHPTTSLYENWLFYSYPLALLLMGSVVALLWFLEEPSFRRGLLFFSILGSIALTRSLFHLGWIVMTAIGCGLCLRKQARTIILSASLPLLVVLAWYAKNTILFGHFSASSWLGMSLAKTTTFQLDESQRRGMVDGGQLTQYAMIPPFSPLDEYAVTTASTGVELLDSPLKANGINNFHHIAYIQIAQNYRRDAVSALRLHPSLYLNQLVNSTLVFFLPAGDYQKVSQNRERLSPIYEAFNLMTSGQVGLRSLPYEKGAFRKLLMMRLGYFLLLGIPILVILSFRLLTKGSDLPKTNRFVLLYILYTVIYVSGVSICFEGSVLFDDVLWLGEQNRFRFPLTPLFVILLGLQLDGRYRRFARWMRRDGEKEPQG